MEKLRLSVSDDTGEVDEIDQLLWPNLGEHVNKIMDDEYVSVQTAMGQGRRMGRSKGDISASLSVLTSVENKLTSLVRNIVKHLELRLTASPTPEVIKEAGPAAPAPLPATTSPTAPAPPPHPEKRGLAAVPTHP